MTTARFRKAFHFPEDSDHEHLHEELDEEEQEQMIQHLRKQNERADAKYSTIFTVIPLLSAMVFAPSILSVSSTLYERLLSLTSALSLAASAYSMKQFPLLRPSAKGKRRVLQAELASAEKTVLPVNSGICVLLGLVYALTSPAESPVTIRPALYLIPGAMFLVTLATRKVMTSVDPSLLEGLRYEYKGP